MKTTINREKIKKKPTSLTRESERLKFFRLSEGLGQVELGLIIGCHQTQVFKYENGKNIIPIDVVKILHSKLNLSYKWFYDGEGDPKDTGGEKKLVTNISEMANTIQLLETNLKAIRAELVKLGADYYEFKRTHSKPKRDIVGTKP